MASAQLTRRLGVVGARFPAPMAAPSALNPGSGETRVLVVGGIIPSP